MNKLFLGTAMAAALAVTTIVASSADTSHNGKPVMQAGAEANHLGKPVMQASAETDHFGKPIMQASGPDTSHNGKPVMQAYFFSSIALGNTNDPVLT